MSGGVPAADSASSFTRAEIETGRKLFAGDWQFFAAAGSLTALPPMRGMEIAFAGRSNVGKSSLINTLVGQDGLARTSRTPGRTRLVNWFVIDDRFHVVDLPGYGYAEVSHALRGVWGTYIPADTF